MQLKAHCFRSSLLNLDVNTSAIVLESESFENILTGMKNSIVAGKTVKVTLTHEAPHRGTLNQLRRTDVLKNREVNFDSGHAQ